MGQVSDKLRRGAGFYSCWCPGCEEMHALFDSWAFNGDLDRPTFSPSFLITGVKTKAGRDGRFDGWEKGPDGKAIAWVCHFILTDGVMNFCSDSLHALAGKSVPLPDLPPFMRDDFDGEAWPFD